MSVMTTGGAQGSVRSLLQLEGLALLIASIAVYAHVGGGWKLFAALILVPDLSMLFYVAGPRPGALAYNAAHSTIGPIALATVGYVFATPWLLPVGLIWLAHIGADRALGYGLKYPTAFGHTHLGLIGRARLAQPSTRSCNLNLLRFGQSCWGGFPEDRDA